MFPPLCALLHLTNDSTRTLSARFATLAWSEMATKQAEYPYGLVAGGMGDGTVNVWDPAKLVANHPQPQVCTVTGGASGYFGVYGVHFSVLFRNMKAGECVGGAARCPRV